MVSPQAPRSEHGQRRDRDWARGLFPGIGHDRREAIAFVYFDPDWRYLGARHGASHDPGAIALPIRDVVRDVLALDAALVLMAHNHPSGAQEPSKDDLRLTTQLALTLRSIEVRLVDHLILGRDGLFSMRDAGII